MARCIGWEWRREVWTSRVGVLCAKRIKRRVGRQGQRRFANSRNGPPVLIEKFCIPRGNARIRQGGVHQREQTRYVRNSEHFLLEGDGSRNHIVLPRRST